MLHYARGFQRGYGFSPNRIGTISAESRAAFTDDSLDTARTICVPHRGIHTFGGDIKPPLRSLCSTNVFQISRMGFGRGAPGGFGAPPVGRGGFGRGGGYCGVPQATEEEQAAGQDYNRFNNDSRLLMEVVQKFPIDAEGKIKPLQLPHLMAELHEDAQEALGNKGGLLKFLQDRGQLFIVKRAPVEGKKDVMAYYCVATKAAARIGAQRKDQMNELREGREMQTGGGPQNTFAQNAAAASGGGFRGGGFGRGGPPMRGGFPQRGAAPGPSGGFGRGGGQGGFGRGGGFGQGAHRGGFGQSSQNAGRGGFGQGAPRGRGGFGAPAGNAPAGRFGASGQGGRFSNF